MSTGISDDDECSLEISCELENEIVQFGRMPDGILEYLSVIMVA